jgi:hypothetical protein
MPTLDVGPALERAAGACVRSVLGTPAHKQNRHGAQRVGDNANEGLTACVACATAGVATVSRLTYVQYGL